MLYAIFDLEVLDDPAFLDLQDADPGHPWRYMRLVQIAKRANEKGRILTGNGIPMDARSLTRVHEGRGVDPSVWSDFLTLCESLELIERDEDLDCWTVSNWKRWHRKPSDNPDRVADRVARHRGKKEDVTPCNASVTPCNATVTPRNACNASEQSRAEQEQSKAEHEQEQSKAEQSTALGSVLSVEEKFDFEQWLLNGANATADKVASDINRHLGTKIELKDKDKSGFVRCLRKLENPNREKVLRVVSAFRYKLWDVVQNPQVKNPWGFCCSNTTSYDWLSA